MQLKPPFNVSVTRIICPDLLCFSCISFAKLCVFHSVFCVHVFADKMMCTRTMIKWNTGIYNSLSVVNASKD